MSDDKFKLTRRKALAGLGGIGAGAALGGTGTMAYLHDTESTHAEVTAGKLDLKLDWKFWYNGDVMEDGDGYDPVQVEPTNTDGRTVLKLNDCKPGDWVCGYFSIHVDNNPAHLWFRTLNMDQSEGINPEPEQKVDDTNHPDLARNTKLAVTKSYDSLDDISIHDPTERPKMGDFEGNDNTYFTGTLQQGLHTFRSGQYLGEKDPDNTYYYGFCLWVPKSVGNIIQGDSVSFDMEFYAEQSRHNSNPSNPFAPETSTGSGFSDISYEKALNMQALGRGGSGRGEIQIHGDSGGVEDTNVFGNDVYPTDTDVPFKAEIKANAEKASLTVNEVTVTDEDVTDGDANGESTGDPEWPGGVSDTLDIAINAHSASGGLTTKVKDVSVNGIPASPDISSSDGTMYLAMEDVDVSGKLTVEGTIRFEGDEADYTSQDWVGIDFR